MTTEPTVEVSVDNAGDIVSTKKVRKNPIPKKVICSNCGREAFSQSFKAHLDSEKTRTYLCRGKSGCTAPATETKE